MRSIFKITIGYVCLVIVVNIFMWSGAYEYIPALDNLYHNGLVIKVKPYAFAFVHGTYAYYLYNDTIIDNETVVREYSRYGHMTSYQGNTYTTSGFVDELYSQGYTHIWTTACHTGDNPYIASDRKQVEVYINGSWENTTWYDSTWEEPWPEYVTRNMDQGVTVPFFTGFGVSLSGNKILELVESVNPIFGIKAGDT